MAVNPRIIFLFTFITCVLSFFRADSARPKEIQTFQKPVYTIQTGSFQDHQRAENQFSFIERSLESTALQALRIEMIGGLYTVRLGRFASLAEAQQILRQHEPSLEGAMVMKAYFIDERIVRIHGSKEVVSDRKEELKGDQNYDDIPKVRNDLGLKLIGTTFVDKPGKSTSIIKDLVSGGQAVFREGDTFRGVLVKKILNRRVIIREGKVDTMMFMEGVRNPQILPSGSRGIQIEEKVIDALVPTYSAMMQKIEARNYYEGGRYGGIIIDNINPDSIFAKMGLENGDVITSVQGEPVVVIQDAQSLYNSLREGGEVTLKIKRGETSQELRFEIN
jgi:general secretion pathway protein C